MMEKVVIEVKNELFSKRKLIKYLSCVQLSVLNEPN